MWHDRAVITSLDHWLTQAVRAPSPNQDARSDPADISLVVVHGISLPPGEFGTGAVERFFCNTLDCSGDPRLAGLEGVRVSAHLLVGRSGAITQFVPFDRRAWHAGVSCWRGRRHCNDFSVGIELEGTDDSSYTDAQYVVLGQILDALTARYPRLDRSALAGHNEIAPGRKTDPGPHFDWRRVYDGLYRSPQPGSARGDPSHERSPQPGSARGDPSQEKSPQPGSARVSLAEKSSARVSLAEKSSARVSLAKESSARGDPSQDR